MQLSFEILVPHVSAVGASCSPIPAAILGMRLIAFELEDRPSLPTVKNIFLKGTRAFPFSLIDNCKNMEHLSLSGRLATEDRFCDSNLPRLRSLTVHKLDFLSCPVLAQIPHRRTAVVEMCMASCRFFRS
jgi:hypothetical protein